MSTNESSLRVIHLNNDAYTLPEIRVEVAKRWNFSILRYDKKKRDAFRKYILRYFEERQILGFMRPSSNAVEYKREDVENFLNDITVRVYIQERKVNWLKETLSQHNDSILKYNKTKETKEELEKALQKYEETKEELEKASKELQILIGAEYDTQEYVENRNKIFEHNDDDSDEAKIEEILEIKQVKQEILFQVISDFIFKNVIDFDQEAYLSDIRNKPDDWDFHPDELQVLAGERLLDLRNYYKYKSNCSSDAASEEDLLIQEIYYILEGSPSKILSVI